MYNNKSRAFRNNFRKTILLRSMHLNMVVTYLKRQNCSIYSKIYKIKNTYKVANYQKNTLILNMSHELPEKLI